MHAPTDAPASSADDADDAGGADGARLAAAAALRDLNHAFVGHDAPPAVFTEFRRRVVAETALIQTGPRRDRLALMAAARLAASAATPDTAPPFGGGGLPNSGYEDRAVAGAANPMSIGFDQRDDLPSEGEDITTQFVLRKGFEGAPGRAHGGVVAAAFDDITGWVIAQIRQPAFTGELTVRFEAPVPVDTELVVTTRLADRDGRKLYITAEMTAHDRLVATCKATYITVDPSIFAGAPDPR